MTINTRNSGGTIRLYKSSSMAEVSSDEMMKSYSHFESVLKAFSLQIEFNFDTAIIEKQQDEELDLISSEVKDQEKKAYTELMKKEIMMDAEDSQQDRWMKLVLIMALVAIGVNYLVQYQSVDAIEGQVEKIMLFSEQAASIVKEMIDKNMK